MSVDASAALTARGDPERFRTAMTAPMPVRGDLMVLYAFNLEIARAAFVTEEPMIAMMRVQWWADALEEIFTGAPVRSHEVATHLGLVIRDHDLPRAPFEAMIAARLRDAERALPENQAELEAYIAETGGALTELAARLLGQDEAGLPVVRDLGWAIGAGNYLRAVPDLLAKGRRALPKPEEEVAAALAAKGLAKIGAARANRRLVGRAVRPALYPVLEAERVLRAVARAPGRALSGLDLGAGSGGVRLGWAHLTGRW